MPDKSTPARRTPAVPENLPPPIRAPFVELGITTCFSFLRGASHAQELAVAARLSGYDAIGVADANTMAGVVRLHSAARTVKLRPVIGCRIETIEGLAFLAYPRNRKAYGRLCRLISAGRRETLSGDWQGKGLCEISVAMLAAHAEDVHLILLPPDDLERGFAVAGLAGNVVGIDGAPMPCDFRGPLADLLPLLRERLPGLRHLAASYLYRGDDVARITRLDALARASGLGLLATNDVHYHTPDRRPLQDVMTAIRHKTTVAKAGYLLHANAERHLKTPEEMAKLFARWPHAIEASRQVADACSFSLEDLQYEYPKETYPEGRTPQQHLEVLTWEGAAKRYPRGVPADVRATLGTELAFIADRDLARYFLTIRSIVDFARRQEPEILCQGRGSAANSAVCFCLGITSVDPAEQVLLFERFMSAERGEPPDIDVDFEHARREEVIQHIYERYGRDKAGLCATVIHYRPRMAIREVGKAMGLSEDVTGALARTVWGSYGGEMAERNVREAGLDLSDPYLQRVVKLAEQMIGMPRHLSQHVGGFILTEGLLTELVPIGNAAMPDRSFIEWDKDDIDELRIMKVDVLALGMLTCIHKCFDLLEHHHGQAHDLATVPADDPAVYDMLCKGDSLGVFQVESRAQMNMLPRLKPRCLYDLVVEVAIVRPGPIQGDMVHPYLQRRKDKTAISLPGPAPDQGPADELEAILSRTLGVPIFQEQAMKIAMDAAKFTPEEANGLRRAMATFRSHGTMGQYEERMVSKMVARGYDPEFAQRCFNQIKGFGDYGFPESHAASFAQLVYVSSWLKCHYPAAFAAALLNSQPMGFYAPAQIVRDAREHGVVVLPVDVNHSAWDCTLEAIGCPEDERRKHPQRDPHIALRLGLRQVEGFSEPAAAKLAAARDREGAFHDVADLRERAGLSPAHIERLASADCFASLHLPRRQALWDARTLVGLPDLPLFAHAQEREEGVERAPAALPAMPMSEEVVADYQTTRLSLKAHPLAFLRPGLERRGFVCCADLRQRKPGSSVRVAGVVLIRQRPGSAKGVCFITLEDETGIANLVIWPDVMERFRKAVMVSRLMEVRGRVEYDEDVLHVIATHLADATDSLHLLSDDLLKPAMDTPDHVSRPLPAGRDSRSPHRSHPRNVRIIPRSRDFH